MSKVGFAYAFNAIGHDINFFEKKRFIYLKVLLPLDCKNGTFYAITPTLKGFQQTEFVNFLNSSIPKPIVILQGGNTCLTRFDLQTSLESCWEFLLKLKILIHYICNVIKLL